MRLNIRRPEFLDHVPPAGTGLDPERNVVTVGEVLPQPHPQPSPISPPDLTAADLTGHRIDIVEGDLLAMDIQPTHDPHWDLLVLPRTHRPHLAERKPSCAPTGEAPHVMSSRTRLA
jgi:hypothetical protein